MLKNKVAIVTGASSGIGSSIAEHLAANGVKVGLLARRVDRLEGLQQTIKSKGGEALAVKCDVANKEQVFEAVDKVRQAFGKIDILVNNAGIANTTMMYSLKVEDWLQVVDVNVLGTLYCYAATLQDMMDKKGGHIINISSIAGRCAAPSVAAYCGSKFFMQGHSAAMRQELAPLGIKVTVIQPGLVKTEILGQIDPEVSKFFSKTTGMEAMMKNPMLEPQDVAETVIFALTNEDRVGINEVMMEPKSIIFNAC